MCALFIASRVDTGQSVLEMVERLNVSTCQLGKRLGALRIPTAYPRQLLFTFKQRWNLTSIGDVDGGTSMEPWRQVKCMFSDKCMHAHGVFNVSVTYALNRAMPCVLALLFSAY